MVMSQSVIVSNKIEGDCTWYKDGSDYVFRNYTLYGIVCQCFGILRKHSMVVVIFYVII